MIKHEGVLILTKSWEESANLYDMMNYTRQVLKEQIGINFSELISAKNEDFDKESCSKNEKRISACSAKDAEIESTGIKRKTIVRILAGFIIVSVFILVVYRIVVTLKARKNNVIQM